VQDRRRHDRRRDATTERSTLAGVRILPGAARRRGHAAAGLRAQRRRATSAQDVGVNVNAIRTTGAFGAAPAKVRKLTRTYDLVTTQNHHTISGELLQQQYKQRVDSLIREADLEHYREHPKFATEHSHGDVGLQLFEEPIK
jgi:hypothetical protein